MKLNRIRTLLCLTAFIFSLIVSVVINEREAIAQNAPTIMFSTQPNGGGANSQVDPQGTLYGTVENMPDNGQIQYCYEIIGNMSGDHAEKSCDFDISWQNAKTDANWTFQNGRWTATFAPVSQFFPETAYRYWFRNSNNGQRTPSGEFSIAGGGTSQRNACHKLSRVNPVPPGFGAAFNTMSTSSETLINGSCNEFSIDVRVGNTDPLLYTYQTAYQWSNAAWRPLNLQCSSEKIDREWCVGSATGTMNNIIASQQSYIIAYTCQWMGNDWFCGCRDGICSEKTWQLQLFQSNALFVPLPPDTPTPPPNMT